MDHSTPARDGEARPTLHAALLMLLGPVFSAVAVVTLAEAHPFQLLRECGPWAYIAICAAGVVALASAGLLAVAAHGRHQVAALAAPLVLLPGALTALGLWQGAVMVRGALSATDTASQLMMAAVGGSELMSVRAVGACLVFGHVLALSGAWLTLSLAWGPGAPQRRDVALGALASLGLAAVALAVISDAQALRVGLGSLREGDRAQLTQLSADAIASAQASHMTLLVVAAAAGFVALACTVLALRSSALSALAIASPLLVGLVLAGGDPLVLAQTADALAVSPPWSDVADFVPLDFTSEDEDLSHTPTCIAMVEGVRCEPGREGPYEALEAVIPDPSVDAGWRGQGHDDAGDEEQDTGEPALLLAVDARLSAPDLRALIEAAAEAGYGSIVMIGAWTPPAFADGHVPAMLRGQAPRTVAAQWWLRTVSPAVVALRRPAIVDIADDDTSESLARRATARAGVPVLVRATPVPPAALAPAPPELANFLGGLGEAATAPNPGATLDPATISRVMRGNMATLRQCYERGLRTQPDLSGRIDVRFTILSNGAVSSVSAVSTIGSASVIACVEAAVGRITFPPGEGREEATVSYPIILNANH